MFDIETTFCPVFWPSCESLTMFNHLLRPCDFWMAIFKVSNLSSHLKKFDLWPYAHPHPPCYHQSIRAPVAQRVKRWPVYKAVRVSVPAVDGTLFKCKCFIIILPLSWYDWNTVVKNHFSIPLLSWYFEEVARHIFCSTSVKWYGPCLTKLTKRNNTHQSYDVERTSY